MEIKTDEDQLLYSARHGCVAELNSLFEKCSDKEFVNTKGMFVILGVLFILN